MPERDSMKSTPERNLVLVTLRRPGGTQMEQTYLHTVEGANLSSLAAVGS